MIRRHKNFLTPLEVSKNSPLSNDYPLVDICPVIRSSEIRLLNNCNFGRGFIDLMYSKLSPAPNPHTVWNKTTIYAQDVWVFFEDHYFQSLKPNNSDSTYNADSWKPLDKFTDECLNVLWEDYLKRYLSISIAAQMTVTSTYKSGAKGLTKYSEDFRGTGTGIITVERAERIDYERALLNEAENILIEMRDFMEANLGECSVFAAADSMKDCNNCPHPRKVRKNRVFHFLK